MKLVSTRLLFINTLCLKRRAVSIGCFVAFTMDLIGCGTPMAVKKLSAEQVKVNISFENTLKAYFDVVEKLTANQLAASTAIIDSSTKEAIALEKKKALNALKNATDD